MNPTDATFPPAPARVSYHEGMLLDATDFQDEQGYHRGQLARTLQRLHGFGTVAGLQVWHFPVGSIRAEDNQPRTEEELEIAPGLAVDRVGRLIEVPNSRCLRLARWLAFQTAQHPEKIAPFNDGAGGRFLVGDVFLSFLDCPQGLRPAFPEGAVDATDAVVASRTRDFFQLVLEPRRCDPDTTPPPVPARRFPAAPATRRALLDALYAAYAPAPPVEYPVLFGDQPADPTAVFLARVLVRLKDAPDTTLDRHASGAAAVEDLDRPGVPPAVVLLTLLPAP